jgi:hypothetical protein
MGLPLRTLHQAHFRIFPQFPTRPGSCKSRTTPPGWRAFLAKRMEAQGFVSKNDGQEKPDREKTANDGGIEAGKIIL